jgi:two-component system cell cycle sensor histidine kinase/response regulator CckA
MTPYLARTQAFFAPPFFPDDEDKTRAARVLNTLLLTMMLFLVAMGGILVPFVFAEKLYNGLFILAAFLMFALAYWLMQRGRVRLASVVHVCTLWIIFTAFLPLAGGMTSIVAVFYVTGTVVAGLLLGTRAALVHTAACSLAGLGMVILETSDHSPPRLFPVVAPVGWVDLTISLLLTTTVLSLVLRSLKEALALARQEVEERKKAEDALRQRERDFSTLGENATDMIVRFDTDLRHVYCNPAVEKQLGLPVQALLGKTPLELGEPRKQAEFIDRSLRKALETGEEQQVEQSYPTPLGVRHFQTRVVPERDPSGRIESLLAITRDITDRQQAEDALRESEELYRRLVETSPTAIVTGDIQGNLTFVNSHLAKMHGHENADELLGKVKNIRELVAPESQTLLEEEFKNLLESGYSQANEYMLPRQGGEKFPAMVSATAIRDSEGKPSGFLAIALDITDRKQAEDALRESEERYRALVENSLTGVGISQGDWVIFANPALLRIFGYDDLEEFVQIPLLDHVAPSSQAMIAERLKKSVQGEPVSAEFEYDIVCKNGQIKTLQAATSVLTLEGEQYKQTTFQDVTDRRRAEEERAQLLAQIQEQAQRIQQIMDTVPEGVLLLDPDGYIVVANPLAEEHLLTLALARVGDTLTHLGDRPLAELLTSPPTHGLWHEVATDSQNFQVIARPIESGPQALGWVLVVHDVTQQRAAERYLQQQERLAALGQLAAGIAHDFNNIMAVITLYASMSSRIPDLPAVAYERLATIDQQAHRASALIQQVLDFSRQAVLERGPLDLLTFLKEQVKLLKRTLPESIQIKLVYGRDEQDAPLMVNADPTRIQQAILNLATNARDVMPEGGQLRIDLERLRIVDHNSAPLPEMAIGEWACVKVTDTGAGIHPDVLPHIFDPFFTTKTPGQGTGLGLSQVYGIVQQHEGRVDVQTQVGEGTTFILYLPAMSIDRPEEPGARTESLPRGSGQTILVVEDETVTRKAMVDSLEMLGYQVLEATNGQEALATFDQHSSEIDLVLTDLVMPEMGGQALFHTLRQKNPTVKILVTSGHPLNERELENLRAQGLGNWLPKPPSLEQLAQAVAQMLEEEGHRF